jgi:hypothetical protein
VQDEALTLAAMTTERNQDNRPSDPKRELTGQSARILDAIDELRDIEVEKRKKPISTPEFHRLAEEVTHKSRDVFRIAVDEELTGDQAPRGEEAIDDLDRERRAAPG